MKRSDLKELIKKSMLEVSPKSGAMTPEEEKMVADYEEEEANKYALDKEEPLEEALNKDIKAFGQDLDKAFKTAGFDTLVLMQTPSAEQMNIVKTNPKAALFEVSQTPEAQTLTVYVNPKQIQKAESIINKFQLSDFNGPVLKKGWTAKQVQGAINPGDIVKQDADKARGMWYFYRLAKVDTKVKSMEEDILREADEIVAAWAQKQTLKEEIGGGYIELMEMNPKFDQGIEMLLDVWEEWKSGEMTEPEMIDEAKQDLLSYLSSVLH
jgi:hypothetical protein